MSFFGFLTYVALVLVQVLVLFGGAYLAQIGMILFLNGYGAFDRTHTSRIAFLLSVCAGTSWVITVLPLVQMLTLFP